MFVKGLVKLIINVITPNRNIRLSAWHPDFHISRGPNMSFYAIFRGFKLHFMHIILT